MQFRFLGTSNAGGFPNPHCACQRCMTARQLGGKNIRRQSSAMINDDLLIDLGPDVSAACIDQGIHLANIRWILQTHPHQDHIDPHQILWRTLPWAAKGTQHSQWFGSRQMLGIIARTMGANALTADIEVGEPTGQHQMTLTPKRRWDSFQAGHYRVLTIASNHDDTVDSWILAIEQNGRRVLYGTDTAPLPDDTWQRVRDAGWPHFDLVVFDHDAGFAQFTGATHMGSGAVRQEMDRMRALGLLTDETLVYATHLAHHSSTTHDEMEAQAAPFGYHMAWDGLIIDL